VEAFMAAFAPVVRSLKAAEAKSQAGAAGAMAAADELGAIYNVLHGDARLAGVLGGDVACVNAVLKRVAARRRTTGELSPGRRCRFAGE
jgi:hypothetical protein